MKFQNNKVYCLHNTGNNFERIFFSKRNKSYFKAKVKKFIEPFAEIKYISLYFNQFFIVIKTKENIDLKLFNQNIGILLGSYTKGVNKEQNRLGSLFRIGTKAYAKFSDFPKQIRIKFDHFRLFFTPSRLVRFNDSIINFLKSVDQAILSRNQLFSEAHLYEILKHPKGFILKDYLHLTANMI